MVAYGAFAWLKIENGLARLNFFLALRAIYCVHDLVG